MSAREGGIGWRKYAPGDLRARLLVASPHLSDPNFERSVVLVLEHGEDGALGVVLNRMTSAQVGEILDPWRFQAELAPPAMIFSGGPVAPNAVIGLARPAPDARLDPTDGWHPLLGPVASIDLNIPPEAQPVELDGVRLFAGYAGWAPNQLEEELADPAWFVLEARPEDVFAPDPGRLWHDVLRRQGGSLAMLASYPPHPSLN